jgi:excisionase family DNA binding protein
MQHVAKAEQLLTIREAALRWRVKDRTVRRWLRLRKVTFVKIGSLVRIPEGEIDRVIYQGTRPRLKEGSWWPK